MALLTCIGYVTEEEGRATVASDKEEGMLAPLQAASITYRIAYGPRQGQKLLTLQSQSALVPTDDLVHVERLLARADERYRPAVSGGKSA